MGNSQIEWTTYTWNPVTGCDKVSIGCTHCYAERLAKTRLKKFYPNGFGEITLHPERLQKPLKLKKPAEIFVNSMSDLFHKEIPLEYIQQVFDVMEKTPQHIYQILTKRAERLAELAPKLSWHSNVWMGVTVESQEYADRIDYLRQVPAKVRFISCEPLLGFLKLDLTGIHWVIVGGESGPNYRPMHRAWARQIQHQCLQNKIPFFFKQWGGINSKAGGRLFDGREWNEKPKF